MKGEKGPVECMRSFDRDTPGHFTFEKPLVCEVGEEVIVEDKLVGLQLFLYARVVKRGDPGGERVIARLYNPLNDADPKYVEEGDTAIMYSFDWTLR